MVMLALRLSSFLVVCLLEVLHGSDDVCKGCAIVLTPPRIFVQHNSSFSADCDWLCGNGTCYGDLKWETPLGSFKKLRTSDNGINKTTVRLTVDRATEWGMDPMCYTIDGPSQPLPVILYKPPDNVSISFVNHTGPLLEGHQYILQCLVQDVAPVQNLTVTFYRGGSVLGPVQSSSTSVETPVTETFTASFSPGREDDWLHYWCEAKLNLGAQGPSPPPLRRSEPLTTTVYFKPKTVAGSLPDLISITNGETLQMNCTAHSNPGPAYSWTGPDNTNVGNGSVLTFQAAGFKQEGQYVCVASNSQGNTTVKFTVDVHVDWLPIIAGVVALLLVIGFVVGAFVYHNHYRRTRTGHYKLTEVFRRNKGNAGLLGVDK